MSNRRNTPTRRQSSPVGDLPPQALEPEAAPVATLVQLLQQQAERQAEQQQLLTQFLQNQEREQQEQRRLQERSEGRLLEVLERSEHRFSQLVSSFRGSGDEPRRSQSLTIPVTSASTCMPDQVPNESRWSEDLSFGIRRRSSRPLTILIEGNIGCGKTTFAKRFLKDKNILTVLEPLDEYRNVAGVNLLEKMYEDPGRYAYPFQHHASMVMRDRHLVHTTLPNKIMERSIYSCKCFIEARRRMGDFEKVEAHLLNENIDLFIAGFPEDFTVDLIVYLRLTPEESHTRLRSRARNEEETVSLDYLRVLHEVHEDWLVKGKFSFLPAPVLILDANDSADDVYESFCGVMKPTDNKVNIKL